MPTADEPTPPHFPIYGVHATAQQVERIIHDSIPGATLVDCIELPRGSSFNNRIYSLRIAQREPSSDHLDPSIPQDLILKISGFCFPSLKIANEVNCLRLVKQHCSNVPVPKVIASSNSLPDTESDASKLQRGWILMEKMPGVRASTLTFTDITREIYLREFADVLASLRDAIPHSDRIGNIESFDGADEMVFANTTLNSDATGSPWPSSLDFFSAIFQAEANILQSHDNYTVNRDLYGKVHDFITDVLPTLPCIRDPIARKIVFTHGDFSDRNILVTQTGDNERLLCISGVVDFEFAGFFPAFEEFLNLAGEAIAGIPSTDDDTFSPALQSVYDRMSQLRSTTPLDGARGLWTSAFLLRLLYENIAPWYVRERAPGAEVDAILAKVRQELELTLVKLSNFSAIAV